MIASGALDKHGKTIEGRTPESWNKSYIDYSAQAEDGAALLPVRPSPFVRF